MFHHPKSPAFIPGVLLAIVAFAPAPPDPPPPPAAIAPDRAVALGALLQARHRAAQKQFDETWIYYKQARTDAFPVYVWSHFVLQTQFDLSDKTSDRITALEAHLDRMKRLDELLRKVRRLGFGQGIELGAAEYYRIEAEYWLAHARVQAQGAPR
jgi:hypothetical protein